MVDGFRRIFAAAISAVVVSGAALAAPPAERQAELLHRLKHDCGSCHGMTMKGGLGPPLLPATLSAVSDAALVSVILDGVPDTPMPPWRPEVTEDEARWIVHRLRQGVAQ